VVPLSNGNRVVIDILFRMLTTQELAAATSFPEDYDFIGSQKDVIKQIGNAVPVNLAEALCTELLRN
jgi:DNA (cytosine-5)-methyltransferase 1